MSAEYQSPFTENLSSPADELSLFADHVSLFTDHVDNAAAQRTTAPLAEQRSTRYRQVESDMPSFHFIDRQGTGWMILAGLPADFPDGGEGHGPFAGLTFRANTGEVRVLPRAVIPRRASIEIPVTPLGTRSRVRELEPTEWEELLQHAVVWPSA